MIASPYALRNRPRAEAPSRCREPKTTINVGDNERWLSTLGGAYLTLNGATRGTWGGAALALLGGSLVYRGLTGHCSLYQALGIDTGGKGRAPATSVPAGHGIRIEKSISINRSAGDLYRFLRNLENLPRFMNHLEAVTPGPGNRFRFIAKAPLGMALEWDAEIFNVKENELIAWRSLRSSDVETAGSMHLMRAPEGRGTVVWVNLKYVPPGGIVGIAIAKLLGRDPEREIEEDLRRLKRWMETGEIARADEKSWQYAASS